jgi:hypothetical protein
MPGNQVTSRARVFAEIEKFWHGNHITTRTMTDQLGVPAATMDDVMHELQALRGLVERLLERRPAPLTPADRDRLARILPAVVGAWGSEPFASRDLPTDAGVRVVLRGLSIKQVGKLLSRGADIPINGLMIERAGHEINVTLRHIVAC